MSYKSNTKFIFFTSLKMEYSLEFDGGIFTLYGGSKIALYFGFCYHTEDFEKLEIHTQCEGTPTDETIFPTEEDKKKAVLDAAYEIDEDEDEGVTRAIAEYLTDAKKLVKEGKIYWGVYN